MGDQRSHVERSHAQQTAFLIRQRGAAEKTERQRNKSQFSHAPPFRPAITALF